MNLLKRMGVTLVLLAGLVFMGHVATSFGQAPGAQKKKDSVIKGGTERPDWNSTKIAFEMRGKPWSAVFEWFVDQTGMPFRSKYPPPNGTFNFINPKDPKTGEPRKYTLAEIYDTVNEFLQAEHKFTLLRLDSTLTMLPADEPPDPRLLRRVSLEELKDCSRTEIVEVITKSLPAGLSAETFAPQVKRMLGPFGVVTPLDVSNQLILQADVKSLRLVVEMFEKFKDDPAVGGPHRLTHKCVYVRAAAAEAILTKSLGQQTVEVRTGGGGGGAAPGVVPGVPMAPGAEEQPQFGKGKGGGPFGGGGGTPRTTTVRPHTVTSDEASNTVFVTGPADKVDLAKGILKDLDKPIEEGQQALLIGQPTFKYHEVRRGDSEAVAKMVREYFKTLPSVRIEPSGPNRLFVYGDPQTHVEINKILNAEAPVELKTEQIMLGRLEAGAFADSLKSMFSDAVKSGLFIEADKEANTIRVRGTADQIKAIQDVVKVLDGTTYGSGTATIILEKGSGATVAEALQLLFPRLRDNPIKVVLPGHIGAESEPKAERLPPPAEPKKMPPTTDKGAFNGAPRPLNQADLRRLMYQTFADTQLAQGGQDKQPEKKGPFFDPREDQNDKVQPKKSAKAPVTIVAFGNRIIVTSDDPDAIRDVQAMVRFLVNMEAGPGDFEVVKLKYASAIDTAKLLDEAYNGPKTQGGGGGGRGGPGGGGGILGMMANPLGAMLGGGGGNQRDEKIRVVADPTTNSMLIRAKPIDMYTIRRLVTNYIDRIEPNAQTIKTYYVQLKYSNANNVAEIIEKVYRESMSARSVSTTASSSPGFSMFNQQRTSDPVADRHALLSFSADPARNAVIVACPEALYKDIENLVKQLDEASKNIDRVASIKDVDTAVVAQVLEGYFAASVALNSQQRPGGGFQGGGGFTGGGFAGGGFQGAGGGFQGAGGGFTGGRGGFTGGGGTFPGGGGFGGFGGGTPGGFGGATPGGFGGATPGGFGGGGMPGGFGGGGARPTGGGGGPAPGGGGAAPGGGRGGATRPGGLQSRGPDFFEQRVMDDPEFTNVFYDPSEEQEPPYDPVDAILRASNYRVNPPYFHGLAAAIAQDKEKEKQPDKGLPIPEGKFLHPELKQAIDILEQIKPALKDAEVEIEMVPIRWGDPTQIASTLGQLYTRVALPQRFNLLISGLRGGVTTITLPNYILGGGGAVPGGAAAAGATPQPPNVALYPQPRLGGILVATTRANMPAIKKEIQRLDQPLSDTVRPVYFPLKHVEAGRVAVQINNFYQARFSPETVNQNQVRITFDDHSNSVIVQAPPADMEQIRGMIEYIDSLDNIQSKCELRVVSLKNAVSDDLARLLAVTIANGSLTPVATQIIGGQAAGGLGATGGTGAGGAAGVGAGGGAGGAAGAQGVVGLGTTGPQVGLASRSYKFKLRDKNGRSIEATMFYDIQIHSDPRTNSLVISAPEGTIDFVLTLIKELDVPPIARSEIRVFTLKKTDATQMALMLQRLFLGTAGTATAAPTGGGGAVGLLGTGTPGAKPLQLTISSGPTPDGPPIIDLRLSVDERTNSLILAGSKNDLIVADTVISTLEDTMIPQQRFKAVRLRNQQATDIANALTPFITAYLAVFTKDNQSTPFLDLQRNIVVQAEPISNSLIVSATPEYFEQLIQMISELDTSPPQVLVSVLVAEVTLNGQEEFGVQIGLQSPVLFDRSIIPVNGANTSPTISYTTAVPTSSIPQVTTITSNGPFAYPGFSWPNLSLPIGQSPFNPGQVGFQGLTDLGVGRQSSTSGVGGFVFSASSNLVSVLVRALKLQERIDVLSRPQLMALDNQTAYINVGQNIPLNTGSNATATGTVTVAIGRQPIGVQLQVTPHITPDGRVIMRVIPEISSVASTAFPLGNGTTGTSLTIQHVETTVAAQDGETVILGGMISKKSDRTETKVPWLGDLPGVGSLFRYRTESTTKTEVIIIMTPHIVRNRQEGEQVLADEARRMAWMLPNVMRVHGPNNMGPIVPTSSMCDPIGPAQPYQTYPGTPAGPGPQSQAPLPAANPAPGSLQRTFNKAGQDTTNLAPALPGNPTSTAFGDNYTVKYQPANGQQNRSTPPMLGQPGPFTQPGANPPQAGPFTQPYPSSAPFAQPNQQAAPFAQPYQQAGQFPQSNQQAAPFTQQYAPPSPR